MGVLALPPMTITCGLPFKLSLRIEDPTASVVVLDISEYEVTFSVAASLTADPFHEGAGEVVDDHAIVEIDGDETADFASLPVLFGRPNAVFQLTLTAPVPLNSLILQGPAIIQGVIS